MTAPTGTDPATQQTAATEPSGTQPGQQPTPGTPAPGTQTATQTAAQAQAPNGQPDPLTDWDGKVESLPDRVQKIIRDARTEAGNHRTAKKEADDRLAAVLKAAGIDTGDGDDPVKALEDSRASNDTLSSENYELRVRLAMIDACEKAGADRTLTTAVLAHEHKLDDLDPTADDFQSSLDTLVTDAVKTNTKLKANQAAAASGVSTTGGPGESATLDAQIAEAEKAGKFETAIALKRRRAYARPGT